MEKQLFYCTVGRRPDGMGPVIPILAESEGDARQWMFDNYGRNWCTSYTKDDWEDWVDRAREMGWPVETQAALVEV